MTDPELDLPEFSYSRRRRREPAVDPLMRRIALMAGGLAVLVIVIALLWSGIKPGGGFGPPPVIEAPPGPLRVAPANPGGLTVPGADQAIMSGQNTAQPSALSPATPAPDLSAFQPPPPPPPPPSAAPKPVVAAPPPPAPSSASALAPAAAPAPTATGPVQVQLAATLNAADAHASWAKLTQKLPGLLARRTPLYSRAMVGGVAFWRLRLGGFANAADARQFCAEMKASGASCTVAAF